MLRTIALVATLYAVSAVPLSTRRVAEPELCCGWADDASDLALDRVTFKVQVAERNLDQLREVAIAVSDPSSPSYGEHLTQQQIDEITHPSASDLKAVKQFVEQLGGASYSVWNDRIFTVEAPVASVEQLLSTHFRRLRNRVTGQTSIRASAYTLPGSVAASVGAIFGLHGLPLPPKRANLAPPAQPADVTPAVIASQYKIKGVSVSRSDKNRQAVAEFQGQTMNSTDLKNFFSKYVPDAKAGDDMVSKFVGDKGDGNPQTEASLDIQYIMGVAPGIKTEFWLYNPMDFCADLKNWTSTMLSDQDVPLVHSVSYGWQGNLSQIGCHQENVDAVDADFVKLAAKGITIIFASGDSGSGYTAPHAVCDSADTDKDTAREGTVLQTIDVREEEECCDIAGMHGAQGWSVSPQKQAAQFTCSSSPGNKDQGLKGTVKQNISVPAEEGAHLCCEISAQQAAGWVYTETAGTKEGHCVLYDTVTGTESQKGALSGQNPKPVELTCTILSSVTGKKPSTGSFSGATAKPKKVQLWPSWPASSPWVTSVGATRFVGQKAGNEEMATDQFGSGGGFSSMFSQSPDAKWQSDDVAHYLKVVPKGSPFPPTDSFPAQGRATPDVSALGEGYQVLQRGTVSAVGGTSASTPAFAGMVSLLNEERLNKGGKPMGFLNPFLYKNADAFTDVTKGTNAVGRGTGPIPYGFNCTEGWDPATGIGTPKFDKLLAAL